MQISGTFQVRAPALLVGRLLQDRHVLRTTIPGCAIIECGDAPGHFSLTAEVGIGPIRGDHAATLTISPVNDSTLDITLTGTGASRIDCTARVTLSETGSQTQVQYQAAISAQGAVARLGAKQIEGAANLLVAQMLRALKSEIEAHVA